MSSRRTGKTSVESTAAPTSAAAVDARMCPLETATVVIASTSGSCVELISASAARATVEHGSTLTVARP